MTRTSGHMKLKRNLNPHRGLAFSVESAKNARHRNLRSQHIGRTSSPPSKPIASPTFAVAVLQGVAMQKSSKGPIVLSLLIITVGDRKSVV